jgi:endonuclease/exonuclease/phosphatase family metal-dependent hydrolase
MRAWTLGLVVVAACAGPTAPPTAAPTAPADAQTSDAASVQPEVATDVAALPLTSTVQTADPTAVVVLNANVMCSFCVNSDHPAWEQAWDKRAPMWRDVIGRHAPDLVAFQELQAAVPTPTPEVSQLLPADGGFAWYYYVHTPTDAADYDYPDATVAWRTSRFELLDKGQFWLSPTPDTAYSTGFSAKGAQFPRLVVWVLLHDKLRNRNFYFANTHFDNNSPSQELSVPLVLARFDQLQLKAPIVFAGDFNSNFNSKAYKLLTAGEGKFLNSWDLAQARATFSNRPEAALPLTQLEQIDHVLLRGATFTVPWWVLDFWRYDVGKGWQAPTDHDGAIVTQVQW